MTEFGPGTVTIGEEPHDFTCEVLSGATQHAYQETGSKRTMLCGTEKSAKRSRDDSVTFTLETDLGSSGLYAYLHTLDPDDPEPQTIDYTPNNADGAKWAGTVVPLLPADVAGSEYGAEQTSTITWPAVGHLVFTPGGTP